MINLLLKLMGDPNEKKVKKIMPVIDHINALEPEFEVITPKKTELLKKPYWIKFCRKHLQWLERPENGF